MNIFSRTVKSSLGKEKIGKRTRLDVSQQNKPKVTKT